MDGLFIALAEHCVKPATDAIYRYEGSPLAGESGVVLLATEYWHASPLRSLNKNISVTIIGTVGCRDVQDPGC